MLMINAANKQKQVLAIQLSPVPSLPFLIDSHAVISPLCVICAH